MVSEMRKRTRKKGEAVGSGRRSSGRNQRVHLLMSPSASHKNKENIHTTWLNTDKSAYVIHHPFQRFPLLLRFFPSCTIILKSSGPSAATSPMSPR